MSLGILTIHVKKNTNNNTLKIKDLGLPVNNIC